MEIYALNTTLALSSSVKDFANRYSYFSTHGSSNFTQNIPENVRNWLFFYSNKKNQNKF